MARLGCAKLGGKEPLSLALSPLRGARELNPAVADRRYNLALSPLRGARELNPAVADRRYNRVVYSFDVLDLLAEFFQVGLQGDDLA